MSEFYQLEQRILSRVPPQYTKEVWDDLRTLATMASFACFEEFEKLVANGVNPMTVVSAMRVTLQKSLETSRQKNITERN